MDEDRPRLAAWAAEKIVPIGSLERDNLDPPDVQRLARQVDDEHVDHIHRFRMTTGQMLFCDNTRIAHDRDAYQTDPHQPRWLWLAAHTTTPGHTA